MSSDMPHPSTPEGQAALKASFDKTAAEFRLASLASAIKEVRKRGGRWNETADAIEWAYDEILRLRKQSREDAVTEKGTTATEGDTEHE